MLRGDLIMVRLSIMVIACALFLGSQACTPCNDLDGDGYGNPASLLCANPAPDCDDEDAARNPGAAIPLTTTAISSQTSTSRSATKTT